MNRVFFKKTDLANVLNYHSSIVPKHSSLPILEYLNVSIENNVCKFESTNQYQTLRNSIICECLFDFVDTQVNFLINYTDLYKLIKSTKAEVIKFKFLLENQIEILTDNGTFTLTTLSPDEFLYYPEFAFIPTNKSIEMLTSDYKKYLKVISTDEYRPAMQGIYFENTIETFKATATDSFRLHSKEFDSPNNTFNEINFIAPVLLSIPKKADTIISLDLLPKIKNELVLMVYYYTENKITNYIYCKLITEKYPLYETVIPKNLPSSLQLDKANLINGLKEISQFANHNQQIICTISDDVLILEIENEELGKYGIYEINLTSTNDIPLNFTCGLNLNLLTDLIHNLDNEQIFIQFQDSKRPFMISDNKEVTSIDGLNLLMPCRIAERTLSTNKPKQLAESIQDNDDPCSSEFIMDNETKQVLKDLATARFEKA